MREGRSGRVRELAPGMVPLRPYDGEHGFVIRNRVSSLKERGLEKPGFQFWSPRTTWMKVMGRSGRLRELDSGEVPLRPYDESSNAGSRIK